MCPLWCHKEMISKNGLSLLWWTQRREGWMFLTAPRAEWRCRSNENLICATSPLTSHSPRNTVARRRQRKPIHAERQQCHSATRTKASPLTAPSSVPLKLEKKKKSLQGPIDINSHFHFSSGGEVKACCTFSLSALHHSFPSIIKKKNHLCTKSKKGKAAGFIPFLKVLCCTKAFV